MTTPSDCYKLKAFFDEMDRGEPVEIQSERYSFKCWPAPFSSARGVLVKILELQV
jgi:hypothetical protein